MKKIIPLALIATLISLAAAAGDDPAAILDKVLTRPYKDLTLKIKLVRTSKSGRARDMELVVKIKKTPDVTKTYAEFTAPPEVAGITSLSWDYKDKPADRWFKLSGMEYVKCVGNGCADLEERFGFSMDIFSIRKEEATHKLLGEEKVGGAACWKIESTPKDKNNPEGSRFIAWIDKEKFAARKIEAYGADGKLKQSSSFTDFMEINGHWWEREGTLENFETGKKLAFKILDARADTNIPDSVFAPPKKFKTE
jgi:hypothetical protein